MAAVNFPNSPSVNDTHTSSGSTWKWDGGVWQRLGVAGPQGSQGVQGAQGHQGRQGSVGIASLTIATSPPGSPDAGDMWWDSDDGDLHLYYNDGNSSQWANINNGPAGAQGAVGAQGHQGVQGATGSGGAAGAQGAQGHQGVQGAANATTINNNANNKVITGSGSANTLEAEASLTFDAGLLKIDDTGGTAGKGRLEFGNSGEQFIEGFDTGNAGSGSYLRFGEGSTERLRIDSGGRLLIGTAANQHNGGDLLQLAATSSTASIQLNRYTANAHPSYINFFKSRNASLSGQTVVQSGDTLGMLAFYGSDGSDRALGAEVCVQVDGTPGSDDMPARIVFRTSADGSQSPSERLRIDNTGWFGAGQTSRDNSGQVAAFKNTSNANSWLSVNVNNNTGTGGIVFGDSDSWAASYIQVNHSENSMQVYHNAAERVRIDSSGMTGVRTAVPRATLHVKAHGNGWEGGLLLEDNTGSDGWNLHPESSGSGSLMIGYNDDTSTSLNGQSATTKLKIFSTGEIDTGTQTITGGNNLAIQNFRVKSVWSGSPSIGKSIEMISGYDGTVKMSAMGYCLTDTNTGSTYGGDLTFHTQPLYSSPTYPLPVRMRISSSGYVTSPRNPKFWYSSLSNSSNSGATNNNEVLVFATQRHNEGSNYSTSNGRFTAPVAGTYHFDVNILMDNNSASTHYSCVLQRNGSTITTIVYNYATSGHYNWMSGSACCYMAVGDYVTVSGGGSIHVGNETSFAGHLIG